MTSRISIHNYEWRNVAIYALFLLALTSLPYLAAVLSNNEAWVFSGHVFGVDDGNSYLGKMRLGSRGYWDFYLFYTSEAHDREALFYLPYIITGQIIGLFYNDDDPRLFTGLIVGFQVLRVIADVLLVVVSYAFIAQFMRSAALRMLALLLSTLGGGLGWLLLVMVGNDWLGTPPPDFFIPEGFGFLVVLGLPHIALARAALLGGFLCLFKALVTQQWRRWAVAAGGCWLLVGLGVSFYLAILYCLIVAWGLMVWLRQRYFPYQLTLRATVPTAMTFPLFFYYVWVFNQNEIFSAWSSQNQLASPHPLQYMAAYAIWYSLAAVAIKWLWQKYPTEPVMLLIGWVLAVPILVYLPINVQRRMAEAVIMPLSILSVMGLGLLIPVLSRRSYRQTWKRWRVALVVILTLSTALLLTGLSFTALNPSRPLFRAQAEMDALDWLNVYAEDDAVVLALLETSNVIPARTNLRVFVGHGPETIQSVRKKRLAQQFFADELSAAEQQDLLARYGINYVLVGPDERDNALSMNWATSLTLIYNQSDYQIYEVS